MRACPLCGGKNSSVVLDLGQHPLADTFIPISRRMEPEVRFPLVLVQCVSCLHFFSAFPTQPESRYVANEYSYESANSRVSRRHFSEFADACLLEGNQSPEETSVADIGSNDGTLLEAFRARGVTSLLGIDPSPNMARLAERKGLSTEICFFTQANVPQILDANFGSKFHTIVSANVVNHADNPHDFLEAIGEVLREDGIYVFEVPNVVDLIGFRAFETIYHEHVHYWSVGALRRLLDEHGFTIFRLDLLDYMCGSIRVFASKSGSESPVVSQIVASDRDAIFENPRAFKNFSREVLNTKFQTLEFLYSAKNAGRRVVGIGAATKGNTLLNFFGLGADVIEFIADSASEKIGKITPGSRIEIVSDEELLKERSGTVAMILPWNIDAVLREKFSRSGFEFITPQITFGKQIGRERAGIYGKA